MECISLKKWADYSYEDKTSLLSYWWDCFGKTIISTDLDHDFTTSWWFNFGKNIITMEEWKSLEKTHNSDVSEISILRAVYSELGFAKTASNHSSDNIDYSESLISSLVTSYNNSISTNKDNSKAEKQYKLQ